MTVCALEAYFQKGPSVNVHIYLSPGALNRPEFMGDRALELFFSSVQSA